MIAEPHPLRCETCNDTDCPARFEEKFLVRFIPYIMRRVGCASHSSESHKGRDGEKVTPSSASSDVLGKTNANPSPSPCNNRYDNESLEEAADKARERESRPKSRGTRFG